MHDDDTDSPFGDVNAEQLAAFVQEYVRRENQPDAAVTAVIVADMRDPRWLPHQIAERLLAKPEIQAAVKALRSVYKPPDMKEVSVDTVSMDLEVIYQEARSARQFQAAIAAKKLQSEITGVLRRDVNINITHRVEDMSTAQLMQLAQRGARDIEGEFTELAPPVP